ncbi:hypothetical protein BCR34DRAFT_521231 [Clohesyomyces aquaticus]|uniref:Uncharacterized protein n=1 Tax=Clohesyomyces aquaticus TaxID=1231657 RepID=A0A1Y1YY66_9PLEO|nr:hypothetical protein BCR34DRAFT_521231 [Clohesyomyces aquaticus]
MARGKDGPPPVCRYFNTPRGCRRGKDCKYSHVVFCGEAATDERANGGNNSQNSRAKKSSSSPQDALLRRWRFHTTEQSSPGKPLTQQARSKFFQDALELVESDASSMQSVIQALATDGGSQRIHQLVKADLRSELEHEQISIFRSTVLPFFKVIVHPKVLASGLLENPVGTIYNTMFGSNGRHAMKLFEYICCIEKALSTQELEPTMAVFANILDKNGTAQLVDGFTQILDVLETAIKSAKDEGGGLSGANTQKWLNRAKHSLGIKIGFANSTASRHKLAKPRARYESVVDGPGELSAIGPRHDNDHTVIKNIQILPTFQEIICDRKPYLPVLDASHFHLPGIAGLLDRHFRLYREDSLGPVRDAVNTALKLQTNPGHPHVSDTGLRINTYAGLAFEEIRCDTFNGLIVTLSIEQPDAPSKMTEIDREKWWLSRSRLQKDCLVCILDSMGRAIFATVAEIDEDLAATKKTDFPYQDYTSNPHRAILSVAPAERKDVPTLADYFSGERFSTNLSLLEFPKILLQTFQPTLVAIREMFEATEIPFADLLAPSEIASDLMEVGLPNYTKQRDFQFDLSCLLTNGQSLALSPGVAFNTKALTTKSTLDYKQAETVVQSLSRRLALCQGPPGTGKSYTGVGLVRVMLSNRTKAELGPILVVTYTNHALDQFLEHLLDSGVDRVVRMGSRSKCERLQDLNLRVVTRGMDRTSSEKQVEYYRRQVVEADALYATGSIRDLRLANSPDELKKYLQENYTLQYEQFWGVDNEGFEMVTYSTEYIMRAWLTGMPTYTGRPRAERSIEELLMPSSKVWEMSSDERKKLHNYWKKDCKALRKQMFLSALDSYHKSKVEHDDARQEIHLRCLEDANIIGITTSGLARNRKLLERCSIKAVLVEEAGEVLESHILTALLPSVEHLILIGDHFQLKPQVANYDLSSESSRGKKYSLDISLFERLVSPPKDGPGVKLPLCTLQTQRRMHPSISKLVRSTLYPNLEDAENVTLYPEVSGMLKCLYWLDHRHLEAGAESNELLATSKSNDFEVGFTTDLVGHLLKQRKYQAGEIAVITPYLGQLFKIRQELSCYYEIVLDDRDTEALEKAGIMKEDDMAIKKKSLKKETFLNSVKVASVDNFQGEEAKVVIVSLVRSNKENNCGFLKTFNRINVLLSRAKHGMYIIGNSETSASVPMWAQVIEMLKQNDSFGLSLSLCCPRHPDTDIQVSTRDDFQLYAPEGGCNLKCDRRLKCGHACLYKCHSDFRHDSVRCLEPCPRTKPGCEHVCPKYCGDLCDRQCRVVLKNINVELPCGHILQTLRCWEFQAQDKIKCTVPVQRTVSRCGHTVNIACHVDVKLENFNCPAPCNGNMGCGHPCKLECWQCRTIFDERHGTCPQMCQRKYTNCSHACQALCHDGKPCGPCERPCEVACSHSRCDQQCGQPCVPCAQAECPSSCPHSKCTMPCAVPCDRIPCSKRCLKSLACGHQCPSLCGETCPEVKYCQVCGDHSVKSMIVDLLEFTAYRDADLNEDALIVPRCGHAKLMSSMDGTLGMSAAYDMNEDGTVKAIKGCEPFSIGSTTSSTSELKDLPGCPDCRGSLRNINRYGRIVRRVLLDEGTKRFVTSAGTTFGPLVERLYTVQERLGDSRERPKQLDLPPVLALNGNREQQFQALCTVVKAWDRYTEIKATRQAIANYFAKVHKDETPYTRLWHLVEHARRKAGRSGAVQAHSSVAHMAFHLMALALVIRCDLMFLADVLNQLKKLPKGPLGMDIRIDLTKCRNECLELIKGAGDSKDYERVVEGHIFYARYCAIERSFVPTPAASTALTHDGTAHTNAAHYLCETFGGKLESLVSEVKYVERSLSSGTFIQPVTSEERRSILTAMANELRGTGHWYTCENGHPFSIGECGMPMEEARCPQCNSQIGGRNHTAVEGVVRATELDEELRRMHLG